MSVVVGSVFITKNYYCEYCGQLYAQVTQPSRDRDKAMDVKMEIAKKN
jgi:hypothetical protein